MNHATRVDSSMLELLPNVDNPTPIVRLNRMAGLKHATVYAKPEWYSPFGAVSRRC